MNQELLTLALDIIKSLFFIVLTLGLPIIISKVNQYIDEKQLSSIENSFMNEIIDIIQKCVDTVTQTFVDSLKASGNFDEVAQKEAYDLCVASIKGLMSTDLYNFIMLKYGNIDSFIKIQIESYLKQTK